jgi:hypothetical protein
MSKPRSPSVHGKPHTRGVAPPGGATPAAFLQLRGGSSPIGLSPRPRRRPLTPPTDCSPTCTNHGHPLSLANVRPLSEEEGAYDPTEAQRAPEGAAQAGPSSTIRTEARTAWRRLTGRARFTEANRSLEGPSNRASLAKAVLDRPHPGCLPPRRPLPPPSTKSNAVDGDASKDLPRAASRTFPVTSTPFLPGTSAVPDGIRVSLARPTKVPEWSWTVPVW